MPQNLKHKPNGMFMPTLLDRLSMGGDEEKNSRHLSRQAYRQSVLRDLQWLLNCANVEAHLPLQSFAYAQASVLNFGIPPYAGSKFTESNLQRVAEAIKTAVLQYEPRIIPKTLEVHIVKDVEDAFLGGQPLFRIEASLWFEPYPIELVIRALWDSENGSMKLFDT